MRDDDYDTDPPPIRRTLGQRVRTVVFLVLLIATATVMVELNGWTDWWGLWRRTMVEFRDGPARPRVKEGMTQAEVQEVLGSNGRREGTFVRVSYCIAPGASGTFSPEAYHPKPNFKVEYPEYGFDVVYHGEFNEPSHQWKVVTVEDRK